MAEKYILTLTPEQAAVVQMACEMLARMEIGQFNIISEQLLDVSAMDIDEYCFRRDMANKALELSACLIYGQNSYGKPDISIKSDLHHRAWNVYQVLRYTRSWHENPKGGFTVNYDKPMNLTNEPLPKCKIERGE